MEYLKRVMLHGAPLSRPKDLAGFFASHAREALMRVEAASPGEVPALDQLRSAMGEALGVGFEGERGEHFFRSTLVQTLFYGVFSAWVLWSRRTPAESAERFDWRLAAYMLNVPMIGALFEQLAMPSRITALGLGEVLDRLSEVLNRVEREAFFRNFNEEDAVQYFYEPFLEAFDPDLRKQFGVWYTPTEVVRYMVETTDRALREDLGIEDGLADDRVYVLDPATGTGSYLVEVLRRIERTLDEKGEGALAGQDLKKAATERVFGFELLPAPFVVAHLQLGLLLQDFGAPLVNQERAGIYLTNALTGWEPSDRAKAALPFPELEEEREAAEAVKREREILVILGNPPYDGFAGVAVDEERDLSGAYRETRRAPKPKGQGLNNLYVRFFRMAERKIVEETGRGLVCFISQYSWLDGLSYPGMRERYLQAFDELRIDCLNGDSYKTGKVAPDGRSDPSIFSTEANPEGIQVGTAISLLIRKDPRRSDGEARVDFRHLWGPDKRERLLAEAGGGASDGSYETLSPALSLGLPLLPGLSVGDYASWPSLPELLPVFFPGLKTSRDPLVVDTDLERLKERIGRYFDPEVSHEEMRRICPDAVESSKSFDARATRERLQRRGILPENFVRYAYRPFDHRWLYWEPETKLLDRQRPEYIPHVFAGNPWIEARQRQPKASFDRGYVTEALADNFGNGLSSYFSLYVKGEAPRDSLFEDDTPAPNVSALAATYLQELGALPEDLFYHVVAMLHSPAYRTEHAAALRQDWPRVALPADAERLVSSAREGREVASLLDVEKPVAGVSVGPVREELRGLATIGRSDGSDRPLDPSAGDLSLTAGWGYRGHVGQVMAGRGKAIERDYTAQERAAIERGAASSGFGFNEALASVGDSTFDVYLNEKICWQNVPASVWHFTAAGYRVVKKWLSYREHEVLGRPLSVEEARYLREVVRRIAALLLMGPRLDENYRSIAEGGRGLRPPEV